jgi:dTDP-4-amino-4,6-dideoxygalactose transaminase
VRVPWSDHTFHQYTLKLIEGDRQVFIANLSKKGIPAMVYYPIPLHKQRAFEPFVEESTSNRFTNSLRLSELVFSLPMHTELNQEIQEYIAQSVISSL